MSTLDSQIITNQALQATAKVNSGKSNLSYTKIVFSSDDLSQKSDDEIKNLTSLQNEELFAKPQTYVTANNTVKATATADNKELKNSFNVKAYGLYAKLDDGNEFLFAVNISSTADYMPAFDGSNTNEVSYGFGFKFADTKNIELTDYNVVSVSKEDLDNAVKNINSNNANLINDLRNSTIRILQDTVTSGDFNDYKDSVVVKAQGNVNSINNLPPNHFDFNGNLIAIKGGNNTTLQVAFNSYSEIYTRFYMPWLGFQSWNRVTNQSDLTSAVNNINNNIENVQNQLTDFSTNAYRFRKSLSDGEDLDNVTQTGLYSFDGGVHLLNQPYNDNHWGTLRVTNYGNVICQEYMSYDGIMYRTWSGGTGWRNWTKLGGVTDLLNFVNNNFVKNEEFSSAVNNINANISNKADKTALNSLQSKFVGLTNLQITDGDFMEKMKSMPDGWTYISGFNGSNLPEYFGGYGYAFKISMGGGFLVQATNANGFTFTNTYVPDRNVFTGWKQLNN